MSIYAMHTDASVFPDPLTFKPERWVGKYNPKMDKHFVPFTKGSRSCLGIKYVFPFLCFYFLFFCHFVSTHLPSYSVLSVEEITNLCYKTKQSCMG